MSNILNRLRNLKNEQSTVLGTAEPVVSRSQASKKKTSTRTRLVLFTAIVLACAFLGQQLQTHFYPALLPVDAPAIDLSQIDNQKNELAVASYKQGDYNKSVETLEALVAAHPERAEFHVNLAMAYQQLSKFDKAQEQLQFAITLDSKDSYALNNLGLLALQTKQLKLAEKSFTQAHEINPKSPEITLNLASYFEKTGQLKKSVETYQRYAELPQADKKTVDLVKRRIPRLSSLSTMEGT